MKNKAKTNPNKPNFEKRRFAGFPMLFLTNRLKFDNMELN